MAVQSQRKRWRLRIRRQWSVTSKDSVKVLFSFDIDGN
jgi:hypothetical protein